MEIVRYLFCTFNLLFSVVGVALVGCGILLGLDDRMLGSALRAFPESDQDIAKIHLTAAVRDRYLAIKLGKKETARPSTMIGPLGYYCLAFGFLIFLLSFVGYCGALQNSACLLGSFAVLLIFVMILEVIGITLFFYHRPTVENAAREQFVALLHEKYSYSAKHMILIKRHGRVMNNNRWSSPEYSSPLPEGIPAVTTSTGSTPTLPESDYYERSDLSDTASPGVSSNSEGSVEDDGQEVLRNSFNDKAAFTAALDAIMKYYQCCGVTNYTDFKEEQLPQDQHIPEACCKFSGEDTTVPADPQCTRRPTFSNSFYYVGCFERIVGSVTNHAIVVGVVVAMLQLIGVVFAASATTMVARSKL